MPRLEGKRPATIALSEGEKEVSMRRAEGERQAAIVRAEGFGASLEEIFAVAKDVDSKAITFQYLDTLKALGNSPSTKLIFPLEFAGLIQPVSDLLSGRKGAGG